MQEKEQGREPLQQKYTGLLSSLTEKWGGGGRLHSFIWRLRLKKSKTIQFFLSFVRDVLSLPCYSGQNHSWGTTSWESDFSDTLIKNIAFEQVSQTVTQYSLCRNSVW